MDGKGVQYISYILDPYSLLQNLPLLQACEQFYKLVFQCMVSTSMTYYFHHCDN